MAKPIKYAEKALALAANAAWQVFDTLNQVKGSARFVPVKSRFRSGLPQEKVQEVIGIEHLVIMEYLVQLVWKRFQELIRGKVAVSTG